MMQDKINIYFAEQPVKGSGRKRYEVYIEGKPSGKLITRNKVHSLLSPVQIREFIHGDRIFYIDRKVINDLTNDTGKSGIDSKFKYD